jgi:hypothetical protein
MDPTLAALTSVSNTILKISAVLTDRRWVLGLAVILFTVTGIASLLISGTILDQGWWQSFFLEVGVASLFTGIVDLAILGLLARLSGERAAGGGVTMQMQADGVDATSLLASSVENGYEVSIHVRPPSA